MDKDSDQKADIPEQVKHYKVPVDVATIRHPELSANAKVVWLVLLSYANKEGVAYPSQETLSRQSALSRNTVRKSVRELMKARLLNKIKHGSNLAGNTRFSVCRALNLTTSTVHSFSTPPAFSGITKAQWERIRPKEVTELPGFEEIPF